MVDENHVLVDGNASVVHFSDADTADIFVVIDGADQNLGSGIRIPLRSRDVV